MLSTIFGDNSPFNSSKSNCQSFRKETDFSMNVTHLECALCGLKHEARRLLNLCAKCGKPLLVRYDLERAKVTLTKESLATRRSDMWRYREVLPVESDDNIVTFG